MVPPYRPANHSVPAVAGMTCIRPMAPFGKRAPGLKPDSAAITAFRRSRIDGEIVRLPRFVQRLGISHWSSDVATR